MKKVVFLIKLIVYFLFFTPSEALSQYAPQVGNIGTTAIHRDSSIIKSFTNYYPGVAGKSIQRGWLNISDTSLGKASVGNLDSIFSSDDPSRYLISLGDGGSITFEMPSPIINGAGFDFVIFENGFPFSKDSFFLELAFVEVSTDGQKFYRFPAYSNLDTTIQIGPFGSIEAHKVHNLAGKYVAPFGVPFDLEDLKDSLPANPQVKFIRLIDVVGSINPEFASKDVLGRIINDPWPTPFPSGGFDLSGIGIIHGLGLNGINETNYKLQTQVFPNPAEHSAKIEIIGSANFEHLSIGSLNGDSNFSFSGLNQNTFEINAADLKSGLYFIQIRFPNGQTSTHKLIKL
ncbi:MAG: T9SS type A sorting domain-containing protein [Bacteroidota bacterium]|nr:T9SS type A sorting domain-containing protein [Bacteroidota bacterium]